MRELSPRVTPHDFNMCLAQADVLLLLSRALRTTCADAFWDLDQAGLTDLLDAAGLADGGALDAAFTALLRHARATPPDHQRAEFHSLFNGAMTCPPNEAAYVRRDKGAILGDASGFYHAFGFAPSEQTGERPDHIATQLEFVGVLLVMRARAVWNAEPEHEEVAREAMHNFAQDHIDPWLGAFARRVSQTADLELYIALADALSNGVGSTHAHAHHRPGPAARRR